MPRLLVACEMSGRVRAAFAKRGWDAWSCDLLPDEYRMWNPEALGGHDRTCDDAGCPRPDWGNHYQGDVLDIIKDDWDLIVAHPPCDKLTQAGARYWKQYQADGSQRAASDFFWKMAELPRSEAFVVIENPPGWISAREAKPDQIVEPWWFGEPRRKKICLWYRPAWRPSRRGTRDLCEFKLPLLVSDNPVEPTGRVTTGGGSWRTDAANGLAGMNKNWEDSQGRGRRKILRSITSAKLAAAMAAQWGPYIEERCG